MNKKIVEVMQEIQSRGIEVTETTVIKNSVERKGLIMGSGIVRPTIYIDNFNTELDCVEIADEVIRLYEGAKDRTFDVSNITSPSYVKENINIAIQKESTEDLIKAPTFMDGIEQYLYITVDSDCDSVSKIKLTSNNVAMFGEEKELWERAFENLKRDSTVTKLIDILTKGMPEEIKAEFELYDSIPMWVISNKNRINGASAILNTEMLKGLCMANDLKKVAILPSSIHEVIVVQLSEEHIEEELNSMVAEINRSKVEPAERLTDTAYVWELN